MLEVAKNKVGKAVVKHVPFDDGICWPNDLVQVGISVGVFVFFGPNLECQLETWHGQIIRVVWDYLINKLIVHNYRKDSAHVSNKMSDKQIGSIILLNLLASQLVNKVLTRDSDFPTLKVLSTPVIFHSFQKGRGQSSGRRRSCGPGPQKAVFRGIHFDQWIGYFFGQRDVQK